MKLLYRPSFRIPRSAARRATGFGRTFGFELGQACAGLAAALALAGCATVPHASASSATAPTLYDRLGGAPAVQAVAGRLIERAASDPRTARSFDGVKIAALQDSLAQQLCALSGGGCSYEGETMANAHADLAIRPSEFDAMVTMLREELDRQGIADGPKNELLRLLAPMKRDVVRPAAPGAARG